MPPKKIRSVLSVVVPESDWGYVYCGNNYQDGPLFRRLVFDRQTWEDMGSPSEVTITIRPGNLH